MAVKLAIEELIQVLDNLITTINEASFSFKELQNQSVPETSLTTAIQNENYPLENLSENPFLKEIEIK